MKITKPQHKSILQSCFFEVVSGIQGDTVKPKSFPLDKLGDAGSTYKKLMNSSDKSNFNDIEIEFTPSEVAILKEVFDAKGSDQKNGFIASQAEDVLEIQALFDGKLTPKDKKNINK